jgi:hypothetical protein
MRTLNDANGRERSPMLTVGLCVLLAIAAFYLWTEHRAHMLGALPYLLLFACPLMHLLMHRGHHHHHHDQAAHDEEKAS